MPPQKPLIVDDRGRQVEGEVGIGPFCEGESLSLECNVPGGRFQMSVNFLGDYLVFAVAPVFLPKVKCFEIAFTTQRSPMGTVDFFLHFLSFPLVQLQSKMLHYMYLVQYT